MTEVGELAKAGHVGDDWHYQIRRVDDEYIVYMHYENVLEVYQEDILFRADEHKEHLGDHLTIDMFVTGWADWNKFETLEEAQEAVESASPKPGVVWHGRFH
jgi:hypothetical protein